jgi:IS30 family transposase
MGAVARAAPRLTQSGPPLHTALDVRGLAFALFFELREPLHGGFNRSTQHLYPYDNSEGQGEAMARIAREWPEAAKQQFWRAWRDGATFPVIARLVGTSAASAYRYANRYGGIPPRDRVRSRRALSAAERNVIANGVALGLSVREMGRRMGRAASTISRELTRNGGRRSYFALEADARCLKQLHRPKHHRLAQDPRLCKAVSSKLLLDWSPQQIAGWLKLQYPKRPEMWVSAETIYRSLFVQTKGILKKELMAHLRRTKVMRHAKKHVGRNGIPNAVPIRERPAEVEDRAVPGHWEGDLIEGSNSSHILTLVERQTRYVMLARLPNKQTETVIAVLKDKIGKLPVELRRTLTWDRGTEMARHHELTIATDVAVYFCDPYSPWQRGTNENTNGLLRQYFPKGTDLSLHTQAELNRVAMLLNTRPRKTLGYRTPAFKLQSVLQ